MSEDLYPTRHGGLPAILPRRDPVCWGPWRPQSGLSRAQYTQFGENGFLVLPGLFVEDEVALLRAEVDRLRVDPGIRRRPEAILEKQGGALRSVFAPHRLSPVFAALARDPRLLGPAELFLGGPVYVHQARVNYKPGLHGESFYWHSDFETWHAEDGLPRVRALSASIALTENTALNGPLLLVPGSHARFVSCPAETPERHYEASLREQVVGTPDDASLEALAARGIEAVTGPAGTVVLFDANAMHASAGNLTPWARSNVFFVYNSVENLPVAPFGGSAPRPEFIAERTRFEALRAARFDCEALGRTR